jgi:hypothetical protein
MAVLDVIESVGVQPRDDEKSDGDCDENQVLHALGNSIERAMRGRGGWRGGPPARPADCNLRRAASCILQDAALPARLRKVPSDQNLARRIGVALEELGRHLGLAAAKVTQRSRGRWVANRPQIVDCAVIERQPAVVG